MSKTARLYSDTRTATAASSSGLDGLNDDLQDVTRIMTKNVEELLWRGDSLDRALRFYLSLFLVTSVINCWHRHVTPFELATNRIREIPQSST